MSIQDIRRARLRAWVTKHGTPTKEKSYFSQVLSGTAPIGERAARRLERDYKMGAGYLDDSAETEDTRVSGLSDQSPWPLPAIPREKIEALAKDPAKLERLQGAVGMALAMLEQGAGGVPVQRVGTPDAANDGAFEAIRKLPVKIAATISGVAPNDIHVEGSGTFLVPTAWIRSKGLHPESLIAVEVKGMSMYPRVHEGDTVVLNVADKQRQLGQVYAFNHEGEFTLKRAEKRANRWYLVSENPDQAKYPPVPCTESTALIGKVVLMQAERV